ncbi:DNA-binding protein HU [termite gut metagenome]|uniref:DNA-binding protein HU n=1 Tax=termite gut metagenome TaxID=433724 RepID=A0A5J4QHC9_9ZZZZ
MNEKLNTQDVIDALAQKHSINKKDAALFVKELFFLIEESLEKDKMVKLKGFGTFKIVKINARESVNVNTGERFVIPEHSKINFIPDVELSNLLNKPFAHFETILLDETGENDKITTDDTIQEQEEIFDETDDATTTIPEQNNNDLPAEQELEVIDSQIFIPSENNDNETMSNEEREENSENNGRKRSQNGIFSFIPQKDLPKYIIGTIGGIIVLSAIIIYALSWDDSKFESVVSPTPAVEMETVSDSLPVDSDTVVITELKREISKKINTNVARPKKSEKPRKQIKNTQQKSTAEDLRIMRDNSPVHPDSVSYTIVGTKTIYSLKAGETLTRVSLRFYGTKNLWPYILKYNKDKIQNPRMISVGMTLRIPELKKKK